MARKASVNENGRRGITKTRNAQDCREKRAHLALKKRFPLKNKPKGRPKTNITVEVSAKKYKKLTKCMCVCMYVWVGGMGGALFNIN